MVKMCISLILLAIVTLNSSIALSLYSYEVSRGLVIITTFPNLVNDVKQIVCSDDIVLSLIPSGIDPHEYTLRPYDVELLKKADIVISTAHTQFEMKIRDLVREGTINAKLIEIPRIPGIDIKKNPHTLNPNLHMLIYDPKNYIAFITYLSIVFSRLRPECSKVYLDKVMLVVQRVNNYIERFSNTLKLKAIADYPFTQYAVEWLGIKIVEFIVPEHGVVVPISRIESLVKSKDIDLVVITIPIKSKPSEALLEIAMKYNLKILKIPSPFRNESIVSKLDFITKQLHEQNSFENYSATPYLYASTYIEMNRLIYSMVFIAIGCILISLNIYRLLRLRYR